MVEGSVDPQRLSRVEKIKRYLEDHRHEIEQAGSGSICIDYAGHEVTVKIGRVDRLREQRQSVIAGAVAMD